MRRSTRADAPGKLAAYVRRNGSYWCILVSSMPTNSTKMNSNSLVIYNLILYWIYKQKTIRNHQKTISFIFAGHSLAFPPRTPPKGGFFFILLYNIVLVLLYINMNPPQVYTCSPSWTPLPPRSPYHPSGSSQCTSPEHPVSCIEPGQAICFTYDIIHVSMPFSQITHPCPLPQSPKDCSIHLCLFCCLAYRVIVTIFLNSKHMC